VTEPVLKTVERNGLGSSNLPPSAIAFVRVPKTGSSSILYETVPEICPGVIDFSYNGSCFINHESNHISVNSIIKKYCNFPKFNQHVSVSVYKNLHTHNHFFYTQVRDPYDIACSLYFFLKKLGYGSRIMGSNVDTDFYNSQLILRGASINDYLENMRPNATFTHYYDELDIKNFDCVGFTNSLGKTSVILNKMFNLNIGPHVKNVNPRKELGEFYNFKFSRRQFKKLNEQEYKIFYDGLQKFESLCKTYVY
jgi:hypothetical protein